MKRPFHQRFPTTILANVKDVVAPPEFKQDARLVSAIVQFETGKIKGAVTRLEASKITSGWYERTDSGEVIHVSNLNEAFIDPVVGLIRQGARNPIDVYWNPHVPGGGGYVCCDDETFLAAYKRLGISLVPCRIFRPLATPDAEAALWIEKRGKRLDLAKTVPCNVDGFIGVSLGEDASVNDALSRLVQYCEETCSAIKAFHIAVDGAPHYHEVLYTVVKRHIRALDSISQLFNMGRAEHALAIVRMAYEAFLNFYIDWLCPQFFGPRLQLLAEVRSWGPTKKSEADEILRGLGNFTEFFENTSEKARVSPLGKLYHDMVYPQLSLVAHQSYKHIESNLDVFNDPDFMISPVNEKLVLRWINLITTALITRVRNDIGLVVA